MIRWLRSRRAGRSRGGDCGEHLERGIQRFARGPPLNHGATPCEPAIDHQTASDDHSRRGEAEQQHQPECNEDRAHGERGGDERHRRETTLRPDTIDADLHDLEMSRPCTAKGSRQQPATPKHGTAVAPDSSALEPELPLLRFRGARTYRTVRLSAVSLPLAVTFAAAGCRGSHGDARDSAAGAMDTLATRDSAIVQTTAATPAIGPLIQVTKTDGKSVHDATQFRLTNENFGKFVQAAESLSVLRARDPQVRQLSDRSLTNAGSTDVNAGLKLLESNDAISGVISRAGLSTRDYFVMGIAISGASRFIDDPKAAPPTPSEEENAKFLRGHVAELNRLRDLSKGPVVGAS